MSLLNPKWKYTPSVATDIRKTFAKARQIANVSKLQTRVSVDARRTPGQKLMRRVVS
jgi:hypothetical protein